MKKKVMVAIPVHRQMDSLHAQALLQFQKDSLAAAEHEFSIVLLIGESAIGRGRNNMAHQFLESITEDGKPAYDELLFIDSDIVFSYKQVKRIVDSDKPIVGGFYCKKAEGKPGLVFNSLPDNPMPEADGLVKVKNIGTGFMKIHRKVFDRMAELMPDLLYTCDADGKLKCDFFKMGVVVDKYSQRRRWMSEDWFFCYNAMECGFDIWADTKVLTQHSGMAVFPLEYQAKQLYSPESMEKILEESRKTERSDMTAGAASPQPPSST